MSAISAVKAVLASSKRGDSDSDGEMKAEPGKRESRRGAKEEEAAAAAPAPKASVSFPVVPVGASAETAEALTAGKLDKNARRRARKKEASAAVRRESPEWSDGLHGLSASDDILKQLLSVHVGGPSTAAAPVPVSAPPAKRPPPGIASPAPTEAAAVLAMLQPAAPPAAPPAAAPAAAAAPPAAPSAGYYTSASGFSIRL